MKEIKIEYGKIHLVGEHHGVKIYNDVATGKYFFQVVKGRYDMATYEYCLEKLDYLKRLKEPLNAEDETGL
ncbi:hypothetical protein ACR79N_02160 [Sphingobacterium siyangense]|uniref:hypothetical protein n=1 Tax=Sphingobacterium siyangense TaxID=459529 RepID=UPI003DA35FA0